MHLTGAKPVQRLVGLAQWKRLHRGPHRDTGSQGEELLCISTGEIGYVVKVDEDGFVCLRVPATNGWPFPHYVFLPRAQLQVVKRDKNEDLQDIEEAPF